MKTTNYYRMHDQAAARRAEKQTNAIIQNDAVRLCDGEGNEDEQPKSAKTLHILNLQRGWNVKLMRRPTDGRKDNK